MFRRFRHAALAAPVFLAACASLNPVTMAKLASLDPLSADPGAIQVAVVAPKELKIATGDAFLRIRLESDDPAWQMDEMVELEVMRAPPGIDVAVDRQSEGLTTARVPQADLPRLGAAQRKGKAFRDSGRKNGKGSLSLGVKNTCAMGPIREGALPVSVYLKTAPGGDFLPVLRNVDLRKVLEAANIDEIEACAD